MSSLLYCLLFPDGISLRLSFINYTHTQRHRHMHARTHTHTRTHTLFLVALSPSVSCFHLSGAQDSAAQLWCVSRSTGMKGATTLIMEVKMFYPLSLSLSLFSHTHTNTRTLTCTHTHAHKHSLQSRHWPLHQPYPCPKNCTTKTLKKGQAVSLLDWPYMRRTFLFVPQQSNPGWLLTVDL